MAKVCEENKSNLFHTRSTPPAFSSKPSGQEAPARLKYLLPTVGCPRTARPEHKLVSHIHAVWRRPATVYTKHTISHWAL